MGFLEECLEHLIGPCLEGCFEGCFEVCCQGWREALYCCLTVTIVIVAYVIYMLYSAPSTYQIYSGASFPSFDSAVTAFLDRSPTDVIVSVALIGSSLGVIGCVIVPALFATPPLRKEAAFSLVLLAMLWTMSENYEIIFWTVVVAWCWVAVEPEFTGEMLVREIAMLKDSFRSRKLRY